MDKCLYPTHRVCCINTRPSKCGKNYFLTVLNLNFNNDFEKVHIYTTSLHQDLYQKLIKCFSNYIPKKIIPNIID